MASQPLELPRRVAGLITTGNAYNSSLIGTSLKYQGLTFTLGPANAADAVDSQTISVSAPGYSYLYLLGAAVNGAQANQNIIVTYSDKLHQHIYAELQRLGGAAELYE